MWLDQVKVCSTWHVQRPTWTSKSDALGHSLDKSVSFFFFSPSKLLSTSGKWKSYTCLNPLETCSGGYYTMYQIPPECFGIQLHHVVTEPPSLLFKVTSPLWTPASCFQQLHISWMPVFNSCMAADQSKPSGLNVLGWSFSLAGKHEVFVNVTG